MESKGILQHSKLDLINYSKDKDITMKRIFQIIIIGVCCLFAQQAYSQQSESLRERLNRRQVQEANQADAQLTQRLKIYNEEQIRDIENAHWMREIYRFIDMRKEANEPLYYPVKPRGKTTNLFTMIFNQILNGNIKAYEYQSDDTDNFSDEYIMKVDSAFFNALDIPFTVENDKYIVDQASIPSNDVKGFFLKELWFFDKNNSILSVKQVALSPVMIFQSDYSAGIEFDPLFWVSYESIKPYASKMPIRTSYLNDASNRSINDFFLKREYKGDIYKTSSISISVSDFDNPVVEDSLNNMRKKIEDQLLQFDKNLWVYNDSIAAATRNNIKTKTKSVKGNDSKAASSSNNTLGASDRATVQKEAKQQNTKKAPIRSMRNRRN